MIACAMLAGCAVKVDPLQPAQLAAYSQSKEQRVMEAQEPVTRAIDLNEALARAIKYNLDARVEVMETALKLRQLDLSNFDMLPRAAASAGFADRNNPSGASSESLLTHRTSLEPSTSSDKLVKTADMQLSWNVLDFGLSYVRAQQSADKALVAEETRRKVIHRIIEDVRSAYWRTVTAERLGAKFKTLEGRVKSAQQNARSLSSQRDTSPLTALTYERELIEIERELMRLEGELKVAKMQLAALINIRPDVPFEVVIPKEADDLPDLGLSLQEMISLALESRSELREMAYRERINEKEARAALLEMLPGIQLYAGANADSNSFLYHNDWVSWGAKASWNMLKVFSYPLRRAEIEAQGASLDQRALSVAMAIMTQVHVSRVRYLHAGKRFHSAQKYYSVQNRILGQMRSASSAGKVSEQQLIREEMNTLVAQVKRDLAYVDVQTSYGNVYASIGNDAIIGRLDAGQDIAAMTQALASAWQAIPRASSEDLRGSSTMFDPPSPGWVTSSIRKK